MNLFRITTNVLIAYLLLMSSLFSTAQTSNLGLNFDGVDDRVTIANNNAYNVANGSFTIEAWVKVDLNQSGNFPAILSKRDATSAFSGILLMVYQGKMFIQIAGVNLLHCNTNIQDNTCHHVAIVRSGTTLSCYVDGVLDGTVTNAGHFINTAHPIWLGRDEFSPATTAYKGVINEVRYWNIARSQSQIQANRNLYLNGNESGLIGYWRMNDGSGQTVNDYSPLSNDGVLGTTPNIETNDPAFVTGCLNACTPPPAVITSAGNTLCSGSSMVLTANTGPGYTYQWSLNGNLISGATNSTYSANTTGTYAVVITANGCSSTASIVLISGVAPSASIAFTGGFFFCTGSTKILSAVILQNGGTNPTFQWKNNGVNITGATNDSLTVSNSGVYSCTVTNNQTGCANTTTNVTITKLNGLPVPVISAPNGLTRCNIATLQIAVPTGGNSYQWKLNNVNIPNATNSTYLAGQTGTYRCLVTNACGSQTSSSVSVVITGSGPITTSGNTSFCTGGINLVATFISGATYQWYNNNILIAGATSQSYFATGHGLYRCTYTTPQCGSVNSSNSISISGPATIVATSSTTFCSGSVTLQAFSAPSSTYQWRRNGVNIAGATSSSYVATLSGSYTCVTVSSLCGTTTSNAVTVTTGVVSPLTLTPAAIDICYGISITPPLIALPFTTGTYNWYHVSSGAGGGPFLIWSDSTTNVLPAYSIYSTNVYAELVTPCGVSTSQVVIIRNTQAAHIETLSPNPSCTSVELAIGPLNFNIPYTDWDLYQWKKNGVNIAGANSFNYHATSSGTYTCEVTCSCGTQLVLDSEVVTITGAPAATISPAGTYNFCAGTSVTMMATPGGTSYVWKKYGNIIPGATAANYTTNQAGVYKVNITFPCGTVVSPATTLVKISNPAASFTASGPTTFCAGQSVTFTANTFPGVTYQWERNNTPINGATLQTYVATIAGNYRVRETANGCTKLSPKTTVSVPCRIGDFGTPLESIESMVIIPNPFTKEATLVLPSSTDLSGTTVWIYDITGKEVRRMETINSHEVTIYREELQAGIYILRMVSTTSSETTRFIIE